MARLLLFLFAATSPLLAQDPRKATPRPDRAAIDAAIDRGLAYLRSKIDLRSDRTELLLWTFIHSRVPESDPDFQKMLKAVLERRLEKTYGAALQAMILEELDRVRYQGRIQQCAQFLIDNQCKDGLWGYGEPSAFVAPVATGSGSKDVPSGIAGPATGERKKPKVVRRVTVKKMKDGTPPGDHSNSQYAALGLRACHDAGVVIPREVLELARKSWRDGTHGNEGTRESGEARGWGYYGANFKGSYGAMTAGGIASLCVYQHLLGEPWVRDPAIERGRSWIAINFSVSEDPKAVQGWEGYQPTTALYYYLYALERAGILYGSDFFGAHAWYTEGARAILASRRPDGSWHTPTPVDDSGQIANTCFAILFLRRATAPLVPVASEDKVLKSQKGP